MRVAILGELRIEPELTKAQEAYLMAFMSHTGHRQSIHYLEAIASEPADLKELREAVGLPPLRQYLLFGLRAFDADCVPASWVDSRLICENAYEGPAPFGSSCLKFQRGSLRSDIWGVQLRGILKDPLYGVLVKWICYLIEQLFVPWGVRANGAISWEDTTREHTHPTLLSLAEGERDMKLFGKIIVRDNQVTEIPGKVYFDESKAVVYQPSSTR